MVLAFRLYGNFHWPPRPDIEDLAKDARPGVVEIHYRKKGVAGDFRPILRWTPQDKYRSDQPLPDIHPSLFDFTVTEAIAWFEDNASNDCAIWIDAGAHNIDTDWVAFRGAFLLEQHRAATSLQKEVLDLRWPLVRSCQYAPGMTVLSGLDVGRRGGPRFCLNLHLPLPARRATLLSGPPVDPGAFPFTAVYEPGTGAFDKILQFTTLVGGWIEGDAVDTSPTPLSLTSFVFGGGKYPSDATLGTFGFSARGERSQGNFAVYNGKQKYKTIDARKFWPDNSRPFTQDMLGRYGFSIDPKSAEWPRLKAGDTTADLSLRFTREDLEAEKPAFIYRIAVSASGDDPKAADDIKKGGNGLSLRLQKETGGWVNTAENLYVDCKLSWHIPDDDIWSTDERRWSPKVDVALHWKNDIPTGDNLGGSPAKGADLDFGLLRHAAHSFRDAREALKPVEAGQARSILPELQADGKQAIRLALTGPSLEARFLDDGAKDARSSGLLVWGRPAATGPTQMLFVRPRLRLTLAKLGDLIQNSEDTAGLTANALKLIASGLTFFYDRKVPTRVNLLLSRDDGWAKAQSEAVADGEPFFASYILEVMSPTDAWSGRLSSLRFDLKPVEGPLPPRPEDLTRTYLRLGGPGTRDGMGDGGPPLPLAPNRIAASIHAVLAVSDVIPVGVDVARMDRSGRPAPLLIRPDGDGSTSAASGYRYWLSIRESIAPTQDRLIEADIYESAPVAGAQNYVVLSEEPFSLYRYSHKPLGDRGDVGSASVATYSGDDRVWQYRKVANHYHYILPPQAVGESADKPRRLEIHDLCHDVADGSQDAIRPFVTEGDNARTSRLRRRVVEFRLMPSTEFWIRPSDVERGYFMPESTSYEIFRQRGEYGLGAALAYLRGEFLYGLSVGIDVSREGAVARQARVAEIEALTGRITGPARDADAEANLSARWNTLARAVARRPERLEVWARDPDSAVDFTPARFADGVSFALRSTALHRPPLARLEQPGDHDAWPNVGGLKPNFDAGPQRLDRSKPRTHPQGLSGGALWPVESSNLFNELLQRPESSGGTIESIALSPTGGDATQKASLLGGIVTIISETRNGHVERQKVEVLGRIGALWHRAKHVVVYERTVNPSAQFAPKRAGDSQRTRSRRPILRKVREYVELLEPERRYPDFTAATPRSTGFLECVRFNSKVINVDSAWSTEISDYGWKIPLWNLLSARERPQVYPMPDIAFVTTAEGDGNNPVVAQECIDTDNLFFFSEFKANTSDTNQWQPRLGIDYAGMPPAQSIAKLTDKPSSGGPEKRRPAVTRILPGTRRFTWRLAPAAQKTAINAGRSGKPVYVGLDSVSFMRVENGKRTLKPLLSSMLGGVASLPASGQEPAEICNLPYWNATGKGTDIPGADGFSSAISTLSGALGTNPPGDITAALTALDQLWTTDKFSDVIKSKLTDAAAAAQPGIAKLIGIADSFQSGGGACDELKSNVIGMIQRKEMLLRTTLNDWAADAENILNELEHEPTLQKDAVIATLCGEIEACLAPVFADASQDVGKLGESIEKTRSILVQLDADIEAIIHRARLRVEQFSAGYDRDKPWSDERRNGFRTGLQACVSNIFDDVAGAIAETRQRFATELDDVSQRVGGHLAKSLSTIAAMHSMVPDTVVSLTRSVDKLWEPILAKLDELAPSGGGDGTLAAFNAKVQTSTASNDLKTTVAGVIAAATLSIAEIRAAAATSRAAATTLDDIAATGMGDLQSAADALSAALVTAITELGKTAKALFDLASKFTDTTGIALGTECRMLAAQFAEGADLIADQMNNGLARIGHTVDPMVRAVTGWLRTSLVALLKQLHGVKGEIAPYFDDVKGAFDAVQNALAPEALLRSVVIAQITKPVLAKLLSPLPDSVAGTGVPIFLSHIRKLMVELSEAAGTAIQALKTDALGGLDFISNICGAVFEGADTVKNYINGLGKDVEAFFDQQIGAVNQTYGALKKQIEDALKSGGDIAAKAESLIGTVKAFDHSVRGLQNDLSRSFETARIYGDRVLDAVGRLDDPDPMAAPSNILKLYSAVSSAPELAALKADIDRIRSGFDDLTDIIDTTEASALFNRLGDELKALGLTLPFNQISDRLVAPDLSNFNIGDIFGNFGGLNLKSLFDGYKMPSGIQEAIRVTHDFDKAQARAWVQVDIDAPMPGRRTLFSLGVFQIDFVDIHLTGQVRLEASKDQDRVTQTGFGRIDTTIDVIAAGQSMVRFEKFALNFTREKGLEIEFDPKNIHLNPSFKFIQDFLSTLFPDEAGGLKIVKQDNIPVGVEHDFVIPPMTLNFGTSGVSNISIENHFKLVAFPDFMIANRFNLSTIERPFIFSIFIIGGTGYIQIDAEYRPFDSQLMVSVEAGAGGSAALAFAVGPFVGQVFITLSGVMTYRKMIGKPGGGLSLAVVVVIAGQVEVCGMVTVGINLMLRLSYRDNGQIDGQGSLTVKIRISRFFTLSARANVNYKLRGGKSETSVTSSVSGQVEDEKLRKRIEQAEQAVKKLQKASN
ncbi:hypothetical protein [Pararhizobium sp. O133]|uniref:hypothetical protein n=1 Tax=Pararhizobium sp. O133 TaxID=3449278 RepID=UPI003F682C84